MQLAGGKETAGGRGAAYETDHLSSHRRHHLRAVTVYVPRRVLSPSDTAAGAPSDASVTVCSPRQPVAVCMLSVVIHQRSL